MSLGILRTLIVREEIGFLKEPSEERLRQKIQYCNDAINFGIREGYLVLRKGEISFNRNYPTPEEIRRTLGIAITYKEKNERKLTDGIVTMIEEEDIRVFLEPLGEDRREVELARFIIGNRTNQNILEVITQMREKSRAEIKRVKDGKLRKGDITRLLEAMDYDTSRFVH